LCSSNTVSLGTQGMKLPLMIVENLKALLGRWVKTKSMDMFFCPIIGQYQGDVLDSADYTATTDDAIPVTIQVFSAEPTTERKRKIVRQNSKNSSGLSTATLGTAVRQVLEAEEVWEPEVEAIINFIDGSSASDFAFINDPKRLEALVSLWNEWVSRYATYSM